MNGCAASGCNANRRWGSHFCEAHAPDRPAEPLSEVTRKLRESNARLRASRALDSWAPPAPRGAR
jgi:hypothetical protein